jgi:hypothetical protein
MPVVKESYLNEYIRGFLLEREPVSYNPKNIIILGIIIQGEDEFLILQSAHNAHIQFAVERSAFTTKNTGLALDIADLSETPQDTPTPREPCNCTNHHVLDSEAIISTSDVSVPEWYRD